jgi:hypothetical protein
MPANITIPLQFVPEIISLDDKIVCLRSNMFARSPSTVSASSPHGDLLWQHQLPSPGRYSGLGTTDAGKSILLQMGYRVLRLDPSDGGLTRLGKSDATGFNERMSYAGDGYLIRTEGVGVELWRVAANEPIRLLHRAPAYVPAQSQVDVLSDGMAAITSRDGDAMWTVEIPSGNVRKIQLDPAQFASTPVLQVVTGSDRERGLLLALFIPSQVDSPCTWRRLTQTATAQASAHSSINAKRTRSASCGTVPK